MEDGEVGGAHSPSGLHSVQIKKILVLFQTALIYTYGLASLAHRKPYQSLLNNAYEYSLLV